jgi:hypothetical protein
VPTCQPAFSAAVIGHVEAAYADDDTRNRFCGPVPYPHKPADWLRMMSSFNRNQLIWFDDPDMMAWLDASRLNVLHHVTAGVSERAREKIIGMLSSRLVDIDDKLEALLAESKLRWRYVSTGADRPANVMASTPCSRASLSALASSAARSNDRAISR